MAQVSSRPPEPELGTFEDDDVREVAVKITKAGDGLSEALKVDPRKHHRGDTVTYILRGRVSAVTHKEVKPGSDDLVRLEVVVTQEIIEITDDQADDLLKRSRDQLRRRIEEQSGIGTLATITEDGKPVVPFEDLDEDAQVLYVHHGQGLHAESPVEGCPRCEAVAIAQPALQVVKDPEGTPEPSRGRKIK